jgi:RNA polymerase sigma factor (sigma-70 family)
MLYLNGRAAASAGSGFPRTGAWSIRDRMDGMARTIEADRARAELAELLSRVAARDQSALHALYQRTSAKLFGICLRVLGSESESQDALQEIYITVWNKASRFDARRASAMTWLSVLARNKAIDCLRARRAPAEALEAADSIPDTGLSALDVLEQAQDATRLQHCLDELEERARTMIRRAFLEGATYPELASRENVPLPTVKSWIRRGLIRLRGCLEQ